MRRRMIYQSAYLSDKDFIEKIKNSKFECTNCKTHVNFRRATCKKCKGGVFLIIPPKDKRT